MAAFCCLGPCAPPTCAEPLGGAETAPEESATELAIGALRLQQAGMYRSATAQWQTFLRRYPEHKNAHKAVFHLGQCFWKLKLYESAVQALGNYPKSFPTSSNVPEALKLLALSRERLAELGKGTFLDAAASFRALFDAAPEGKLAPFALYREAQCFYSAGKFEKARSAIEVLLRKSDAASVDVVRNAWLLRALIALRLDEKDAARKAFNEITAKWPQDAIAGQAHYHLGDLLHEQAKYAEAAEHFRAASKVKEFRRADFALLRCGQAFEIAGESEHAKEVYRSVRQRFPKSEVLDYADERLMQLGDDAGKRGK